MWIATAAALLTGLVLAIAGPWIASVIGRNDQVAEHLTWIFVLSPLYVTGGVWQSTHQATSIHPTQTTQWKKQLLELVPSVFEGKHARAEASVDVDALYKKIGQLEMERDFLASRPEVSGHQRRDG